PSRSTCAPAPLLVLPACVLVGCLLFCAGGHHADLRPFPTRRSSDLRGGVSVLVNRDAPLGVVVEELRRKLSSAGDFFAGASIRQIGRAACRERVEGAVVAGALKEAAQAAGAEHQDGGGTGADGGAGA